MRYILFCIFLMSLTFATSLKIYPSNVTMKPGSTLQFTAVLHDADGSMYSPRVTWISDYGTLRNGNFTAPMQAGRYTITASSNRYSAKAIIHVKQAQNVIQKIIITPSNKTMTVNKSVQFKAIAYDHYGRVVQLKSPRWWCDGGTISNGYFTASRVGRYNIWVQDSYSRIKATVYGKIIREVYQPKISRIVITPSYGQTLNVGGYLQLKATAYDNYNRVVPSKFNWSSDYGTVSNSGYFVAGNRPGRCTIWAKDLYSPTRAKTVITIVRKVIPHPPAGGRVHRIVITPRNKQISVGEGVQLQAIAYDSYGREVNFKAKWWTNYGTIDQRGYYSAHRKPGRYEIFVKARRSNIQASAYVTVIRKIMPYPPHPPLPPHSPGPRIDVTYWDVDRGSIFHRSKVKVKFNVHGKSVQKAALYGIYPTKRKVELDSTTCRNGEEVYFRTKFSYHISRLEIRLYDSYGDIITKYNVKAR